MGKLAKKQSTVKEMQEQLKDAAIAFVVDPSALTVKDLTDIRQELYKNDAQLTVMKNTLLKRAIEGTDMEALSSVLAGPTALAIGRSDQVAPIKIIRKFFKDNKKENDVRGAVMEGNFLAPADIEVLAQLPPLEELRGKLVGGIASPLNGLVLSISGPQRGLVTVLDKFAKHQQQQEAS